MSVRKLSEVENDDAVRSGTVSAVADTTAFLSLSTPLDTSEF